MVGTVGAVTVAGVGAGGGSVGVGIDGGGGLVIAGVVEFCLGRFWSDGEEVGGSGRFKPRCCTSECCNYRRATKLYSLKGSRKGGWNGWTQR